MGIGIGIVLLVLGLVLVLGAVDISAIDAYIASNTLGWILIAGGALALVMALILNAQRGRTKHVEERREE
ncbi:hypothetical protein [Nocardioides limicola]|uniref:hypothetical protein n=1 Tax=Nocardioides limicola TaxID=2803368 RepID=UPI00193AE2F5|nr:hypothetical protein [Nocardioides sp. DJM-14]